MSIIKAEAQYDDYIGECRCDGHNGPFLTELCEKYGLKEFLPIGLEIYFENIENPQVYLLVCDKKEHSGSFDEIKLKVKDNSIHVYEKEINISLLDLFKYMKRFSLVLKLKEFKNYEFVTDE